MFTKQIIGFKYLWYNKNPYEPYIGGKKINWIQESNLVTSPAGGAFNSFDPVVMAADALAARNAGFTAFAVDWHPGLTGKATSNMQGWLDACQVQGLTAFFMVCGTSDPTNAKASLLSDIDALLSRFGNHPAYTRTQLGHPMLWIYHYAMGDLAPILLSASDWNDIIAELAGTGRYPTPCVMADRQRYSYPTTNLSANFGGNFDYAVWPRLLGGGPGGVVPLPITTDWIKGNAAKWYPEIMASNPYPCKGVTVGARYDESALGRPHPLVVPDHGGDTLQVQLDVISGMTRKPDWVAVNTVDEWMEQSATAPGVVTATGAPLPDYWSRLRLFAKGFLGSAYRGA